MKTCAVIVAAGLSSRMGAFKPLLPLDGKPAVICLLDTLMASGVSMAILVTGFRHSELVAACRDISNLILIHNAAYASTQMFDSAKLGFAAVPSECDRVLFTPADIPLVSQRTIHRLISADAPVMFPGWPHRKGHPIALDAALLPYILHFNGSGGLKNALAALPVHPVYAELDDPFIFMDMDTPTEYQALVRQSHERGVSNAYETEYVEFSQLAEKPEHPSQLFDSQQ